MKEPLLGSRVLSLFFLVLLSLLLLANSQSTAADDASVMLALKKSLNVPDDFGWNDNDPCKWTHVGCSSDNRITRIQIGRCKLQGVLPPNLNTLTALQRFEVQYNELTGSLPSLSGLSSLQIVLLSNNQFGSIPPDFFSGMSSLQAVSIDNNPLLGWEIPDSLQTASSLQNFSAVSANITGKIPDFFGAGEKGIAGLTNLHLSFNSLEGGLPASFAGSTLQTLWLNGQKLNGTLEVLEKMTSLKVIWLHSNDFSGPLPDLSGLPDLEIFSVRDNSLTGPVPASLTKLTSLKIVNLTNNMLQGPTPEFDKSVAVDMNNGSNSFCLDDPGVDCDSRVNIMLSIAQSMWYPKKFAENWKGNDPCTPWLGLTCNSGQIVVVNFQNMGLTGTISSNFSALALLERLILANNYLTGTIPSELASLPKLNTVDVSNNQLHGEKPAFRGDVNLNTDGNPDIGKNSSSIIPPPGRSSGGHTPPGNEPERSNSGKNKSKNTTAIVWGSVAAGSVLFIIGFVFFVGCRKKLKQLSRAQTSNSMVIHPHHSGSDQDVVKITIAGSSVSGGGSETQSHYSSGPSDIHRVEAGNMMISIQVLRNVTNNFSQDNILGRGGFGTVYKGELHDGTKIAVKRMESGVVSDKGLNEFKAEIAVLSKVRHRHLVALLGYCLDGNERLLVYEYMPQGTLSQHIFHWKDEDLKPLEWTKRLAIVLDVARGVEYLHGLTTQVFIHRDLKPSNILLGDDMRAKVADFGLVRLAPEGESSIQTRLAGTFGYLAPEYAVTGRVTTKVDVFSFGVILMEVITGRKALDESQPDESMHLVTWFRKNSVDKDTFRKAIDPTIELDEETLASISTVAEIAGYCCAREPTQRPDMAHVVNVLSSLADVWKPTEVDYDDIYAIDFGMSLQQAVKKWQALEGNSNINDSSSSYPASRDSTQTSIPNGPPWLADSFISQDGR